MCDRTLVELQSLPESEAENLIARLHTLRQRVDPDSSSGSGQTNDAAFEPLPAANVRSGTVGTCEFAGHDGQNHEVLGAISIYLSTRPAPRNSTPKRRLLPLHTWHYEQIASPRGVLHGVSCPPESNSKPSAFSCNRWAAQTEFSSPLLESDCPACEFVGRPKTKPSLLFSAELSRSVTPASSRFRLCVCPTAVDIAPHRNEPFRKFLLNREAALMERIAEDMQRYAIKYDALRRDLASAEEHDSYLQALQ